MENLLHVTEASIIFNEHHTTTLRCIKRYVQCAEQPSDLLYRRQLQCVETCSKMYQGWRQRQSISAGVSAWRSCWSTLMSFLDEEPKVDFKCPFLEGVSLEVEAISEDGIELPLLISTASLSRRFALLEEEKQEQIRLQRHYITMMVTHILDTASTAEVAISRLQSRLEPLLGMSSVDLCTTLKQEMVDIKHAIGDITYATLDEDSQSAENVLKVWMAKEQPVRSLAAEFTKYKLLLKPLRERLEASLRRRERAQGLHTHLQHFKQELNSMSSTAISASFAQQLLKQEDVLSEFQLADERVIDQQVVQSATDLLHGLERRLLAEWLTTWSSHFSTSAGFPRHRMGQ